MYADGYGEKGTIPTMLANIKTLTDTDNGVVVTNKTIADNFDKKLSETPSVFGKDSTYSALFTGISSAITGDPSASLSDVSGNIITGASSLSQALSTMFTNAQNAIDKAKEEAEKNANQYADSGDGAISTVIENLHPEEEKPPKEEQKEEPKSGDKKPLEIPARSVASQGNNWNEKDLSSGKREMG